MSAPVFEPQFKGPIEGYVRNHLAQNYWRVESSMTRDEVMQEAHCVFLRLAKRYEGKVTEPRHFMSLFTRSWGNHFVDLSKVDSKHRQGREPLPVEDVASGAVGALDNDGYLQVLVKQAPPNVRAVLSLFLTAPPHVLAQAVEAWSSPGRPASLGNEHVARLLGMPAGSKPLDDVYRYFSAH